MTSSDQITLSRDVLVICGAMTRRLPISVEFPPEMFRFRTAQANLVIEADFFHKAEKEMKRIDGDGELKQIFPYQYEWKKASPLESVKEEIDAIPDIDAARESILKNAPQPQGTVEESPYNMNLVEIADLLLEISKEIPGDKYDEAINRAWHGLRKLAGSPDMDKLKEHYLSNLRSPAPIARYTSLKETVMNPDRMKYYEEIGITDENIAALCEAANDRVRKLGELRCRIECIAENIRTFKPFTNMLGKQVTPNVMPRHNDRVNLSEDGKAKVHAMIAADLEKQLNETIEELNQCLR